MMYVRSRIKCITSFSNTNSEVNISANRGRDDTTLCSKAEGLVVEGTESTGQTTFVDEACARVDVATNISNFHVSDSFVSAAEFFTRPVLLKTGTLPTTRTQIDKYNVLVRDIWALWGSGGTGRVANAALARFRPVFTLQIGTTPFAQGLLCLSFNPAWNAGFDRQGRSALATNLPHVLLDVASQTTVVLRMPFLWYNDAIRVDNANNFGTVSINAVLPVSAGSATTPQYKLYFHLEDLVLSGVRPAAFTAVTLQAGSEERVAEGPISGPLRKAGDVMTALGQFSSLRPYAKPLEWFTRSAAKTAFSMGFSKPVIQDPPKAVVQVGHYNQFNVDMPFVGPTLGPFNSNAVRADPTLACSDVDEMDLKYVTSQFGQLAVGSIATTDAHATTLWWTNITPACYYFIETATTRKANKAITLNANLTATAGVLPTHLGYWAQYFRLWRGTTKFRFTFAKTKMHGGRVMVEFVPYGSCDCVKGAVSSGTIMQPTGYTKLFDLRDGNTFEFEVPYISDVPWSATLPGTSLQTSIGTISLRVMDPLVTSSVTSNTVPFLVEVAAGPDFELGMYYKPFWTTRGVTTVVEQSGGSDGYSHDICQVTLGEKFNSVKQLMMMPIQNGISYTSTAKLFGLRPWWYRSDAAESLDGQQPCPASLIAECYAFCRGKTYYHAMCSDVPDLELSVIPKSQTGSLSRMEFPQLNSMKGQLGFVMPHYPTGPRFSPYAWRKLALTKAAPNWQPSMLFGGADNSTIPEPTTYAELEVGIPGSSTGGTFILSHAAADDAAVGMYLGPLPCTYSGAAPPGPSLLDTVVEEHSGGSNPSIDYGPVVTKPELSPAPVEAPRLISLSQPLITGTLYKIGMYRVAYGPFTSEPVTTAMLVSGVWPDSQIFFRPFLSPSTGQWYAVAYVKIYFCDTWSAATTPIPIVTDIMVADYELRKAYNDSTLPTILDTYFPATALFTTVDNVIPPTTEPNPPG